MTDLNALAWYPAAALGGIQPLGYTPKFCTDCGSALKLDVVKMPASAWKFDPVTGQRITDTFTEYRLGCPCRGNAGRGYLYRASERKEKP